MVAKHEKEHSRVCIESWDLPTSEYRTLKVYREIATTTNSIMEMRGQQQWGQNIIKKRWDYKYPISSPSQKPAANTPKGGEIFRFFQSNLEEKTPRFNKFASLRQVYMRNASFNKRNYKKQVWKL